MSGCLATPSKVAMSGLRIGCTLTSQHSKHTCMPLPRDYVTAHHGQLAHQISK